MVGIDDMALYVPKIYLDIKDLAEARNLEYVKLNKGLGLSAMALPDVHEDAATMAANAVMELIEKNNLDPRDIGRIYLGTESALDGAKPTATYALTMLEKHYSSSYGANCFRQCDVVDLTFACVGGVDALQNTLDWAANGENRMGIVVTADNAKYELASSGEYTQGAGAIAMLIKQNPRLLAIDNTWGVSCAGVHDFYKPKRTASKADVIQEVLDLFEIENVDVSKALEKLQTSLEVKGVLDSNDTTLTIHKDTPVFDGQYSNQCYQDRIGEAFEHFKNQRITNGKLSENESQIQKWARMAFHLPYAFHAKRIFSDIFLKELEAEGKHTDFIANLGVEAPNQIDFEELEAYQKAKAKFLRAITKTDDYRAFVKAKIEKGQRASSLVGNMYACSIFLSLMSSLNVDAKEGANLDGESIGLVGYGSGSKSKVFEGVYQPQWKEIVKGFDLENKLNSRKAIDYNTYEALHTGKLTQSVISPDNEFCLKEIGTEGVREGARYYEYKTVLVDAVI